MLISCNWTLVGLPSASTNFRNESDSSGPPVEAFALQAGNHHHHHIYIYGGGDFVLGHEFKKSGPCVFNVADLVLVHDRLWSTPGSGPQPALVSTTGSDPRLALVRDRLWKNVALAKKHLEKLCISTILDPPKRKKRLQNHIFFINLVVSEFGKMENH